MTRVLLWTCSGALLGSLLVFLGMSGSPVLPVLPERAVSNRERLIAAGSTAPTERWLQAVDTAYPADGLLRFQSRLPVFVLDLEGYERALRKMRSERKRERSHSR